ncbi:MAG: hypothetical protein ACOYEO_07725 [bacterium]
MLQAATMGSLNIPHAAAPGIGILWQITSVLLVIEVIITALYLAGVSYIYDTKLEL